MNVVRLLVLVSVLFLSLVAGGSRPAQTQTSPGNWIPIGPLGPQEVIAIAAPPRWPVDPIVVAVRREAFTENPKLEVVRTSDGGNRWVAEALPPSGVDLGNARVSFFDFVHN